MCVKSFKCKISMALMVEVVNNVKIMKALKGKLLQILKFLQVSYDENIVVIINIDSSNHLQNKVRNSRNNQNLINFQKSIQKDFQWEKA